MPGAAGPAAAAAAAVASMRTPGLVTEVDEAVAVEAVEEIPLALVLLVAGSGEGLAGMALALDQVLAGVQVSAKRSVPSEMEVHELREADARPGGQAAALGPGSTWDHVTVDRAADKGACRSASGGGGLERKGGGGRAGGEGGR